MKRSFSIEHEGTTFNFMIAGPIGAGVYVIEEWGHKYLATSASIVVPWCFAEVTKGKSKEWHGMVYEVYETDAAEDYCMRTTVTACAKYLAERFIKFQESVGWE